jgi:hypothetical protein
MEPLTNDQLISLIQGTFSLPGDLYDAVLKELRSRLPAIAKPAEKDEVYYQIKDLHERLDQTNKKLGELGGAAVNAKFAALFNGEQTMDGSHRVREAERTWRDEDMLNFATIVFYRSPAEAAKLIEEYKNRPIKK